MLYNFLFGKSNQINRSNNFSTELMPIRCWLFCICPSDEDHSTDSTRCSFHRQTFFFTRSLFALCTFPSWFCSSRALFFHLSHSLLSSSHHKGERDRRKGICLPWGSIVYLHRSIWSFVVGQPFFLARFVHIVWCDTYTNGVFLSQKYCFHVASW